MYSSVEIVFQLLAETYLKAAVGIRIFISKLQSINRQLIMRAAAWDDI